MTQTTISTSNLQERAEALGLDWAEFKGMNDRAIARVVAAEEGAAQARQERDQYKAQAHQAQTTKAPAMNRKLQKALTVNEDSKTTGFLELIVDRPDISGKELAEAGYAGWAAGTAKSLLALLHNEGHLSTELSERYVAMIHGTK